MLYGAMGGAVLIIDTRQQNGKHRKKHEYFERAGVHSVRSKLIAGDYQLVGGVVSVDTKRDINELCNCLDGGHVRFRNEMIVAKEAGIKLIILTENEDGVDSVEAFALWREPDKSFKKRNRTGNARRRYGKRFAQACRTMMERYGVTFEFCSPDEAGERVLELLGWDGGDETDGDVIGAGPFGS